MNLQSRIMLAVGQTDSSSFVGRKYTVVDTKYGHMISEHDNPEDAEKAASARPYSKVVSRPLPQFTPVVRDMARQRLVKTNPDVDAYGTSEGVSKEWDERGRGKKEEDKPPMFHPKLRITKKPSAGKPKPGDLNYRAPKIRD